MKISMLLILLALILAACAGDDPAPQATAEPSQPTQAGDAASPTQAAIIVTRDPSSDPFGVVSEDAEVTEDPNPEAVFDSIKLVRVGGGEGVDMIELDLRQDGTYVRNGVAGVISQQEVMEMDTMLDELRFFDMAGDMIGPGGDDFSFTYVVTVQRADGERVVQSQDGMMPQEYREFITALLLIGA
jgi:hypothetical protein